MNAEEALTFVRQISEKKRKYLTEEQKALFKSIWQGYKLNKIPIEKFPILIGRSIRDDAVELYRKLEIIFDAKTKITKKKLKEIVEQEYNRRSLQGNSQVLINQSSNNLHIDWGNAPEVLDENFYGRIEELQTLEQWIVGDRCRLITILGIGGMGKTDLSVRLGNNIQDDFDYVIWKKLENAPDFSNIVTELVSFLSDRKEFILPENINSKIDRLLDYLRKNRCLIILDNLETIFKKDDVAKEYQSEEEKYQQLFQKIGELNHQSCLIITSREISRDLEILERKKSVRLLLLQGLHWTEGKKVFHASEDNNILFTGLDKEWKYLIELYDGNPLALELNALHIKKAFSGNISRFLNSGSPVSANLLELLEWHFGRLSDCQKEVMYWLAINREPVSCEDLQKDILTKLAKAEVPLRLQDLQRSIPLKQSEDKFSLQPVLMEYFTNRLIDQICDEIKDNQISILNTHALLKAQAPDYIKETQIKLILKPIIECLHEDEINIEEHLNYIVTKLSKRGQRSYTAGNIINLFCHTKLDLNLMNSYFSNLRIMQANFQGINLHNIDFSNCYFESCVFTQRFAGVHSLSFNCDGSLLATGGTSGKISIWNTADYQKHSSILENERGRWVYALAFSPTDANILASGSDTNKVKLWDISSKNCQGILAYQGKDHKNTIRAISFSKNGKYLASTCHGGLFRLWDVAEASNYFLVNEIDFKVPIWDVDFNSNGYYLAITIEHEPQKCKTLIYSFSHDVNHQVSLKPINSISNAVFPITFHPQKDNILCTDSAERKIVMWDVQTGECLRTFPEHKTKLRSIDFSSDGSTLACDYQGSKSSYIKLYNLKDKNYDNILQKHSGEIRALAFHPCKNILVSSSYDSTTKFWDIDIEKCIHTIHGYDDTTRALAFHPQQNILASGSDDCHIRLWDADRAEITKVLVGHTSKVWAVAFSHDGEILASSGEDKSIRLWYVNRHDPKTEPVQCDTSSLLALAFSPTELKLISSDQTIIKIWKIQGYLQPPSLIDKIEKNHDGEIKSLAFSSDGKLFASSDDKLIKIWDASTYKEILELSPIVVIKKNQIGIRSISFNPINRYVIVSGDDKNNVTCWDLKTKAKLWQNSHDNKVKSVAFSHCGRLVVSASEDKTIRLWNAITGECLSHSIESDGEIHALCLSSESKTLATAGEGNTIMLHKLQNNDTYEIKSNLEISKPYKGMKLYNAGGLNNDQILTLMSLGAEY